MEKSRGGKRPNSGRKPKNYPYRVWVSAEEKEKIKQDRKESKKAS